MGGKLRQKRGSEEERVEARQTRQWGKRREDKEEVKNKRREE